MHILNANLETALRLTSFTDFGLRMLMRMAAQPESALSTVDFAQEFGLSRHHLAKIIQRLADAGIVETRRGSGGGARLARPARDISLAEIVRLLEADQHLVECFSSGDVQCSLDGRCRLKGRLREAENAFLRELDRTSLAEVAIAPVEGLQ